MTPLKRIGLLVVVAFLLLSTCTHLNGAIINVGWELNGLTSFGASPFANTISNDSSVTATLSRGSGVTTSGSAAGNAWGGNGFVSTNLAAAIAAGDFVNIDITYSGSTQLSLTKFNPYNIRRSSTGPTSGQFQFLSTSNVWTNLGSTITWGSNTTSSGNIQSFIDLTSIGDLQNRAAGIISFRIVNWGATGPTGTWYLNNFQNGTDFSFEGLTSVVPEPSTLVIFGSTIGLVLLRRRRATTMVI